MKIPFKHKRYCYYDHSCIWRQSVQLCSTSGSFSCFNVSCHKMSLFQQKMKPLLQLLFNTIDKSLLCFYTTCFYDHLMSVLEMSTVEVEVWNSKNVRVSKCVPIYYLRLGLKSTYSRACVELLAVEIKLNKRKTRSGTPSSWVSCLWMICSLNDICCCVFLRNRYQPMTFYMIEETHLWKGKKKRKKINNII